jgi:hypothetical protein
MSRCQEHGGQQSVPQLSCLSRVRADEAVFAAYGRPSAPSDEEILERLLALNLERGRSRL